MDRKCARATPAENPFVRRRVIGGLRCCSRGLSRV